jgi:hypothetical protein
MRPSVNHQGGPIVTRSRKRAAAGAGAGLVLALAGFAVAGCSQALPLGPAASAPPAPVRLASSIVMQPGLTDQGASAGHCPAGSVTLSGPGAIGAAPTGTSPAAPGGVCFHELGRAVTFTSAGVTVYEQPAQSQPAPQPASWNVAVNLPAAEAAALTSITTKLAGSQDQLAIIVGGQTWGMPITLQPLTHGEFVIGLQSKDLALRLQRLLIH